MIINKDKIKLCDKKIKALVDYLDIFSQQIPTTLIITSGKRNGTGRSWHNEGLAVDFYFNNVNVFKKTTELYKLCKSGRGVFEGVTEFEVCRGGGVNHYHIAFGREGKLETFTGIYR